MSARARAEQDVFNDLAELCASPGYIHAIAWLSFRDNLIQYGDRLDADAMQSQYAPERLLRTEISTLIGLMGRHPIDLTLPTPDTIQLYIDRTQELLHELHTFMSSPLFNFLKSLNPNEISSDTPNPFERGENLREPIFYAGESAYGFQYLELAEQKYSSDNAWLFLNKGFEISDATCVASAIVDFLETQSIDFVRKMKRIHPSQWTMLPCFIFSINDISSRIKIDADRIKAVFSAFTYPTDNTNPTFLSLHDFNAANAFPILSFDNENFILLQAYSLLEAIYESPFFWTVADKAYASKALKHRGQFTEVFSTDRLAHVFENERVHRGVNVYKLDGNIDGEIDTLVIYGRRAIILQAKSKRLTIESRKGNDNQIRDDFRKAIQDAYEQAFHCGAAILTPGIRVEDSLGTPIDVSRITTVLPLCIVSDHYPALAMQARQLLKLKQSDNILNPIVTDVFSLDIMSEMLATPLQFLHYLSMRSLYSANFFAHHELTLLSYHLKHNLFSEENVNSIVDDAFSTDLDIAVLARRTGVPGAPTPDGILTRYIGTSYGRLLEAIENSNDPDTVELGLWLVQLNEGTAKSISLGIDKIAEMARRDRRRHDFTIGLEKLPSGLTMHATYEPIDIAVPELINHCDLRKYAQRAGRWFGLVIDPDTRSFRVAVRAEFPWKESDKYNDLTRDMRKPLTIGDATQFLKNVKGGKFNIGRNEKCLCGSGMKYKRCCLRLRDPR